MKVYLRCSAGHFLENSMLSHHDGRASTTLNTYTQHDSEEMGCVAQNTNPWWVSLMFFFPLKLVATETHCDQPKFKLRCEKKMKRVVLQATLKLTKVEQLLQK